MSINPIGGAGGGFDPDRKKSREERHAEAERLKEERKRKREGIAKEHVEKGTKDTREDLKKFWTDENGDEHVDARA